MKLTKTEKKKTIDYLINVIYNVTFLMFRCSTVLKKVV